MGLDHLEVIPKSHVTSLWSLKYASHRSLYDRFPPLYRSLYLYDLYTGCGKSCVRYDQFYVRQINRACSA